MLQSQVASWLFLTGRAKARHRHDQRPTRERRKVLLLATQPGKIPIHFCQIQSSLQQLWLPWTS